MRRMKYDIGSRVVIYEDPITKEKPEGKAILRELYAISEQLSRWRVEFEDELGQFYARTIATEEGDEILAEETKG
jgi:hypothetical protein